MGLPGRSQGLNTGVVLFDLQKMRNSEIYNGYLVPQKITDLFDSYQMKMLVGDQDWFTLLSFQEPNLISILPCQFNAQTSLQYWSSNKATFHSYHYCDVLSKIKIFHKNGCGPRPEDCGAPAPVPLSEYRQYIRLLDHVIQMDNFWTVLYCAFRTPCELLDY